MPIDVTSVNGLKTVSNSGLKNICATIFGSNISFVDFSLWTDILPNIHNILRGFIYPLMILFNLDMVYFLIRGTHFLGGGKD